jgi:hypothetical protein
LLQTLAGASHAFRAASLESFLFINKEQSTGAGRRADCNPVETVYSLQARAALVLSRKEIDTFRGFSLAHFQYARHAERSLLFLLLITMI